MPMDGGSMGEAAMSLLDARAAQGLLEQTQLNPASLRGCRRQLTRFMERYLPQFYRKEQAGNAVLVVEGLLSDLERKTCEPIARRKGVPRKPVQFFVGQGKWDDEAVMAELRRHVAEELGDVQGVLILDPSAFPKKGTASCGVQRQWCGRLGKIENCQVGVFLGYATARGQALVDRRLFLPEEWAQDAQRRALTQVPQAIAFQTKLQIGLEMLRTHGAELPHGWVTGDDEFGRSAAFRGRLRSQQERYLLDVPRDTLIRDLERPRPARCRRGRGRRRKTPLVRAELWAAQQPPRRWRRFRIAAGEQGPLELEALSVRVQAMEQKRLGPEERLLVMRTREQTPRVTFALSNAQGRVALIELVRVACQRHAIEELFEAAKGETGLAQYEVRRWDGWHHHMTLSMLALWFLTLERRRLGKKLRP